MRPAWRGVDQLQDDGEEGLHECDADAGAGLVPGFDHGADGPLHQGGQKAALTPGTQRGDHRLVPLPVLELQHTHAATLFKDQMSQVFSPRCEGGLGFLGSHPR